MTYLLDTDVCIDLLRNVSPGLLQRVNAHDPADLRISAITHAELLFGALRSSRASENLAVLAEFAGTFVVLPFEGLCVQRCAEARLHLESRGTPIGPNDLLIAATALAHDLTIVTYNTREFSRVVGLRTEDWGR